MSNQYIYRIVPNRSDMLTTGPTELEGKLIGEHVQYLMKLSEEGICMLAGRTQNSDETTFGIMVYKADSEEAAKEIMNNDPAINGGVFKAEFFPFKATCGSLLPVDDAKKEL
jgi:uncharacterized protein YciI